MDNLALKYKNLLISEMFGEHENITIEQYSNNLIYINISNKIILLELDRKGLNVNVRIKRINKILGVLTKCKFVKAPDFYEILVKEMNIYS